MEKNFTIKGKQLACTLAGSPENPPIILLHGILSHRGVWRQTIAALQGKYYCVSVDLLGFGASDKPDGSDYSLTAQAQRILMLADLLGFKKFSLIGHSMGAQIAIYIASALAPARIERLVSVSGIVTGELTPQAQKSIMRLVGIARKQPWLSSLANSMRNAGFFAKSIFRVWFFDVDNLKFEAWEADRTAALNPAGAIASDESYKALRALDLTQHLHKIRAKTLIIFGKQDGMVPMDQALLAQTLIPGGDLALIEKCGHFPMYEKTGNYLKAISIIFPTA